MKYKAAICKINMIGAPALILGICHYDDDHEFWDRYQVFTLEDRPMGLPVRAEFCGKTVHFKSIGRDIEVFVDKHDFDLNRAKAIDLTSDEFDKLKAGLFAHDNDFKSDGWESFDWETWGK